jgi:3-mercaptopyruvate sulfurtransferase SseA
MQLITNFGYQKIAVLDGGWERWQELGYPTEKGN